MINRKLTMDKMRLFAIKKINPDPDPKYPARFKKQKLNLLLNKEKVI